MGHGWRRVTEAVRQKVGSDRAFKATSNARNEAMFKEATDFCTHLRVLERDLRSLQKEVDGTYTTLRGILLTPLPRAYEEGLNGAVPASDDAKLIGQGVQVDGISQASQELKTRLEEEVIKPLRSWLMVYKTVSDRMTKLEALRLEVDSRRRTVDALAYKLDRLRSTQPPPQHKEKHESEVEKATMVLQHKNDKLTRTSKAYVEMEQQVFNSLTTLIKDTGVLRDYACLSLALVQECYNRAHSAFSTATPLVEYTSTTDNMFQQQSPYREHMPMALEKTASERALTVRQQALGMEQRVGSSKDAASDRGAAMYALAEDATDGPYGLEQQHPPVSVPAAQLSPGRGNYYQDVAPAQQQGGNPYAHTAYTSSPGNGRYVTAGWQQGQGY